MAASSQADTAILSVALLNQQIEAARSELALLRGQLVQLRSDIADAPGEALRAANELLARARSDAKLVEAVATEAHGRRVSFLATVAHELRNPLMPLRLAAVMLDRARTDEAAHARLQATITGQVAQMTRLIGDLLEGSRISTGNFRLERTVIDLNAVLDRAIETSQPGMDARKHRFERSPRSGPVMVLGDAVRLVQVFGNLLENASKYTLEGGAISLRVGMRGHAVVVTITDNGIGISEKALPHVFDMFVRDQHATEVNEGGLGIGLAVVRELIKAHEGSVGATSAGKSQGSEFVVMLPVAAVSRTA
jgi:signal transduction histidine kinase